jgi:hypothetical protein
MHRFSRAFLTTPEKTLADAEKDKTGSARSVKLAGMMTPNAHGDAAQPRKAAIVERAARDWLPLSAIRAVVIQPNPL